VAALTERILPALPLPNGVVMPQMVVTISAESPEAIAAASSAGESGELLLVPRVGDRYATVGSLARVESTGTLPGGAQALVVRATGRARIGTGVVGTGAGLWVTADAVVDEPVSDEARRLGTELRATLRALFDHLGGRRLVEFLGAVGADDPGALADLAGWWPELDLARKVQLLETIDVESRVRLVLGWAKEALAEVELAEKISTDVRRDRLPAARVPAAAPTRRDPQGAR
jgi:ATP-dependent Lon protease